MTDPSYWFYLEPFVYVVIHNHHLLLYNTLTGDFLTYYHQPHFADLIRRLHLKENLYALEVTRSFLEANHLESFIADIKNHFMGDLLPISLAPKKPFLMPPNFDIDAPVSLKPRRTLKNVMPDSLLSLNHLTLYIHGQCNHHCQVCPTAYRQSRWCTCATAAPSLELTHIRDILHQTRGCPIKTIDILGGDLSQYPDLNALVALLDQYPFQVYYYFHLYHLQNGLPSPLSHRSSQAKIVVLVDGSALKNPDPIPALQHIQAHRITFLIQQEAEIPLLERVIARLKNVDIAVQPFFNGHNLDFFKANVFTDRESLRQNVLNHEVINARKSYNTLNYGRLFIMSDQNIYSDLNDSPLGNPGRITLETAVVNELSQQGNWLKTRREVSPCNTCLFNSLCPPLSNFETFSGINNFCLIWKESRSENE